LASAEGETVLDHPEQTTSWKQLRPSVGRLVRRYLTPLARKARRLAVHQIGIRQKFRRALAVLAPVAGILLFSSSVADATVDTRPALAAAIKRSRMDPRAVRLSKFFKMYNCPTPTYIPEYLRIADQNDLDYRLLPAISIRETQCGLHDKGNNWLGFHPDWSLQFRTPLEGIELVGKRLGQHPFYKGKSLEKKLFTYNPYPKYPGEVMWIMSQIEP
jgi:hypothetical protein